MVVLDSTPRMNEASRAQGVSGRSDRTQMDEVNMLYEKFTESVTQLDYIAGTAILLVALQDHGPVSDTPQASSTDDT